MGMSATTMWLAPTSYDPPMLEGDIDWKETGALIGVLGSIALILWKLLRPFWERIVQKAMQPWITYIKRNVRRIHRLRRDVDKLDERVSGVEAAQNLNASISTLHEDAETIRQALRDARRVREGDPPTRER